MCQWRIVLDNLLKQACHTHLAFLGELKHPIQFKMLKVDAALCQPQQHIFFKREALLFNTNECKFLEAVIR